MVGLAIGSRAETRAAAYDGAWKPSPMKRFVVLLSSALAVALLLSPGARASVSRALSLAELVSSADHIVLARAGQRHSRWHHNGKLIVTDVSLRVESALKGDARPGETLTATVLGGKLEGLGLQVPGAASFETGARAIVFLYQSEPSGDLRVVGMSQGVLPLREQDGATMVIPGGSGAALMQQDDSGALRPAPDALAVPRPMLDVVDEIRRLVASDAAKK
jgi:hypothetical protein